MAKKGNVVFGVLRSRANCVRVYTGRGWKERRKKKERVRTERLKGEKRANWRTDVLVEK